MPRLIAPLFDGPLDVIGDIHGEIDALNELLHSLGYDHKGCHPAGRRLVFLGDLVDRGPDSPAVLECVMRLVGNGRAQCILGNHELNLLRKQKKEGNGWFRGCDEGFNSRKVAEEDKPKILEFLAALPLALEREDLRVVHACWNQAAVNKLRAIDNRTSTIEAYSNFERGLRKPDDHISKETQSRLKDKQTPPALDESVAKLESAYQMGHPMRVLTSGEEAPVEKPFWAGGKWRMVKRVKWWENYECEPVVLIGHYWRKFAQTPKQDGGDGSPDLFEGTGAHHWLGPKKNIYCVDFSVGKRYRARQGDGELHHYHLAAVRWPKAEVVTDHGAHFTVESPSG